MELEGAELLEALRPLSEALPHVPALTLDQDEAAAVRQGQQPRAAWLERLDDEPVAVGKSGRLFRMLDGAGDLVAVGQLDDETGEPRMAAVIAAEMRPLAEGRLRVRLIRLTDQLHQRNHCGQDRDPRIRSWLPAPWRWVRSTGCTAATRV